MALATGDGMSAARDALHALQTLASQWMDKEREGIALIEGFQTALLAARAVPALAPAPPPTSAQPPTEAMQGFAHGAVGTKQSRMDPWLLEDLYGQVKALRAAFEELLSAMYAQQDAVSDALLLDRDDDNGGGIHADPHELRVVDYAQHITQEVAAYEAEFQHIEALLAAMSFEITTDELRTLVISWSTSPFLNPEHGRAFRQRQQQVTQQ
ncbi:hypothetical protein ATCC90586_008405 [Pythium insidiosum]|nr:hypothetical protein ATCC90586_008405 [Pythium insidiosum]